VHLGTFSCAGGNNFPFCAEKDTSFLLRTGSQAFPGEFDCLFLRRRVLRSISGALGDIFLRRRLQFSIPRGKRYPIPAQKGAKEDSWRKKQLVPAQNVAT
jgi:hypothetical protein